MAEGDEPPAPVADYRDPAPFTVAAQGHSFTFYPRGPDRLTGLLELIDGAQERLDLVFYIFAPDPSGRQVREALVRAAQRGVAVTIIVDGFGAEAGEGFFAPLIEAGGAHRCFIGRWSARYLIRNHQKFVIADGDRAMLGGFNVEDDYFKPSGQGWTDLAFIVKGPVVTRIARWFAELDRWAARPKAPLVAIRRAVRRWNVPDEPVQLLIGGPTRGLSSWARCVSRDLARGERLDMMMAYFSPPPQLRSRIARVARRGATRLVMAAKSDNTTTVAASRALYGKLLGAGARIWEFEPTKLHTKLIVLDNAVYLGSANLDMRSLYINLEIVLRIEDAALAERMRGLVENALPASRAITPERHRRRATPLARLRWWTSWFLVSVVDYTVSRKLNLGL